MRGPRRVIGVSRRTLAVLAAVTVMAAITAPTSVATHIFTDVEDTDTHAANIAWLASTGVTAGCNPPANDKFCPNNFVSRKQMASFLRRLAENRVVDAGTLQGQSASSFLGATAKAADADKLDGQDSTAFALTSQQPGAAQSVAGTGTITLDGTTQTLLSQSITAPTDGYVLVTANLQLIVTHTSGTDSFLNIGVSDIATALPVDQDVQISYDSATPTGERSMSTSPVKIFPVTAGTHTFYLLGDLGTGVASAWDRTLSLVFIPNAYGTVATSSVNTGEVVFEQ